VQAVKEKTDAVGRYEKMAAERDRLMRDRAVIQKQLQDKERQFDEILREVRIQISVTVTHPHGVFLLFQVVCFIFIRRE
jgi:hypothetical protein